MKSVQAGLLKVHVQTGDGNRHVPVLFTPITSPTVDVLVNMNHVATPSALQGSQNHLFKADLTSLNRGLALLKFNGFGDVLFFQTAQVPIHQVPRPRPRAPL